LSHVIWYPNILSVSFGFCTIDELISLEYCVGCQGHQYVRNNRLQGPDQKGFVENKNRLESARALCLHFVAVLGLPTAILGECLDLHH
jgi:hypothetical protein